MVRWFDDLGEQALTLSRARADCTESVPSLATRG